MPEPIKVWKQGDPDRRTAENKARRLIHGVVDDVLKRKQEEAKKAKRKGSLEELLGIEE